MILQPARSSDRILESALDLFIQKGFDATSVREICEAARITKPTLYHFYKSKDGVYRALVDGVLEEFRRTLQVELEAPGSTTERLKRVARAYFALRAGPAPVDAVHLRPDPQPARLRAAAPTSSGSTKRSSGASRARVEEGVERGELAPGPTELRMLVLMGSLGESLCGYMLTGRPELTDELAGDLVDTILGSWYPR